MTEAKWLAWPDPYDMLEQCLICELTDRKLRLFACACCRKVWHRLEADCLRAAIQIAEMFADAQLNAAALRDARSRAVAYLDAYMHQYWPDAFPGGDELTVSEMDASELQAQEVRWAVRHAAEAVVAATAGDGEDGSSYLHHAENAIFLASSVAGNAIAEAAYRSGRTYPSTNAYSRDVYVGEHAERLSQANLLRDIFGNPFHKVSVNSNWLVPTVLELARTIYDNRAFDSMPILGDALEETGCDNQSILSHCRSGNEHVRGCWVVDTLLGKS